MEAIYLKNPEIFVKLFPEIIVKSRFGNFVIFKIIWNQNPFNLLFKNIILFESDFKYNYGVIVGGLAGFYVMCFFPFLFCDLKISEEVLSVNWKFKVADLFTVP